MEDRTIAAVSTAYGESGIGIVRMSGPKALDILKLCFSRKENIEPRYMYHGFISDDRSKAVIDEVLAVYMKAPHSYTGEDVVEIQCHGGMLSVKKILELCLHLGAFPAERGEFTKRAFMNGRLDLSQAESVIDLIKARSALGYAAAISQFKGSLSGKVNAIRKQLLDLLVELTVNMDYPDEDIEIITYEKIKTMTSLIDDELLKLLQSSHEGKMIREGIRVAIIGRPNVGKSSLMNALLRSDRSIVTDIPGTTRDTIEEQASIRGILINFIDTAGIHESEDLVEELGIRRSKAALDEADFIILMFDGSKPVSQDDLELYRLIKDRPHLLVCNKSDLGTDCGYSSFEEAVINISCKEGSGIEALEESIENFIFEGKVRREEDLLLTNARHINLVEKAHCELQEALNMVSDAQAMDFIEINVRSAFDYLGEITGDTAADEVINEVFSRFCLGK